jgi:hypothetical protein
MPQPHRRIEKAKGNNEHQSMKWFCGRKAKSGPETDAQARKTSAKSRITPIISETEKTHNMIVCMMDK